MVTRAVNHLGRGRNVRRSRQIKIVKMRLHSAEKDRLPKKKSANCNFILKLCRNILVWLLPHDGKRAASKPEAAVIPEVETQSKVDPMPSPAPNSQGKKKQLPSIYKMTSSELRKLSTEDLRRICKEKLGIHVKISERAKMLRLIQAKRAERGNKQRKSKPEKRSAAKKIDHKSKKSSGVKKGQTETWEEIVQRLPDLVKNDAHILQSKAKEGLTILIPEKVFRKLEREKTHLKSAVESELEKLRNTRQKGSIKKLEAAGIHKKYAKFFGDELVAHASRTGSLSVRVIVSVIGDVAVIMDYGYRENIY